MNIENSLEAGQERLMARAQARAQETWHTMQDQTQQALERTGDYVRAKPVPTMLSVLACGILVGWLLPRPKFSLPPEKPLVRSKGFLLGMSLALGSVLRKAFQETHLPRLRFRRKMALPRS